MIDLAHPVLRFAGRDMAVIEPILPQGEIFEIPGVDMGTCGEFASAWVPRNCWVIPQVARFFEACGWRVPVWQPALTMDARPSSLRPYQADAASYLVQAEGSILGDDLGLGKTRTAAIAADGVQQALGGPVLILAPRYLRTTWRNELLKAELIVHGDDWMELDGASKQFKNWKPNARFIFCHYEILRYWWDVLWPLRPAVAILDEAHFLKTSRSLRANAASIVAGACRYRFLLTGTPIPNRVAEFWNLLRLATGPGHFHWGRPTAFRQRYAGAYHDGYGWKDGEPTHVEELRARLSTCYIARTYEGVGFQLPPIMRELIQVEMRPFERQRYASLFSGYDPREIAAALLQGRAGKRTLELLGKARKIASRAKLATTCELLDGFVAQSENVVVFSWEREIAEGFVPGNGNGFAVHGGIVQKTRDEYVAQWGQIGGGGILSATYGALGAGVNLQHARVVVLHDLDWVPATMVQAEGRVWRGGQTKPVVSKWIVAQGTLDELIAQVLLEKAETITAVLDRDMPIGDVLGSLGRSYFEGEVARLVESWRAWRTA